MDSTGALYVRSSDGEQKVYIFLLYPELRIWKLLMISPLSVFFLLLESGGSQEGNEYSLKLSSKLI